MFSQTGQVAVNSYLNYLVVYEEPQSQAFEFAGVTGILVLAHFSVTVVVFFYNRAYAEGVTTELAPSCPLLPALPPSSLFTPSIPRCRPGSLPPSLIASFPLRPSKPPLYNPSPLSSFSSLASSPLPPSLLELCDELSDDLGDGLSDDVDDLSHLQSCQAKLFPLLGVYDLATVFVTLFNLKQLVTVRVALCRLRRAQPPGRGKGDTASSGALPTRDPRPAMTPPPHLLC